MVRPQPQQAMTLLRVVLGFVIGVGLYQVCVVLTGGIFAAVAVSRSYFEWFVRPNLELALAVCQLLTFTLPIVVLVAGGTLAAHRLLGLATRHALASVLTGLLACFAFWVAVGVLALRSDLPGEPYPTAVLIRQMLLPPWWSASGFWAPWLGFLLAAWLIGRRRDRETLLGDDK